MLYSAGISPRFISSTSYWCTLLMYVSPTFSTSYDRIAFGPTLLPLRDRGKRSPRPLTSQNAVDGTSPEFSGPNLTVSSNSVFGQMLPSSGYMAYSSSANSCLSLAIFCLCKRSVCACATAS